MVITYYYSYHNIMMKNIFLLEIFKIIAINTIILRDLSVTFKT